MKMIFTSLIIAAMISNCEDTPKITDISSIEYGTSFGSCLGYCVQVVTYTESLVSKKLTPTRSTALAPKECAKKWSDFNSVANKIDTLAFNNLKETIGCPDCADGGAEWIKITTPKGAKKVTFEYGNEPKELKSLISDLRKYYDQLGECD